MRNFLQNFSNMFFRHESRPLGRWQLKTNQTKINQIVDRSNIDHCGPCGMHNEIHHGMYVTKKKIQHK